MRKAIRSKFAELLQAKLPTATVWKYRKADPKGVSPLLMVCSAGTNRMRATTKGSFPNHYIRIYSLVLHSDPDNGWTEEKAEDQLDDHEQAIAEIVDVNQKVDGYWRGLAYEIASEAERVELGGIPYLLEVISMDVTELK